MAEYIEREAFLASMRNLYCKDCNRRKGMKNGKLKTLYEIGEAPCRACGIDDVLSDVEDFPAADVRSAVWTPVTEMLPDFEGSLLCMRKTAFGLSGQEVLYYEDGEFSYDGIERLAGGTVTHWMPLPHPPKN